jgi:two-component system, response regulator YesN
LQILVVDDEVLVRETVINILNSFGIDDILEAQDGIDALNLLNEIKPDIIIADIRMPGIDGIELLSRARKIHEDIIFILLSGYDLFEYAQKAIQHGAFSYLLKPVSDTELKSIIDKAVETLTQKNRQQELNSLMRIRGTQGAEFLKNRFISELVKGNSINEKYYTSQLKELNICLDKDQFCVFLICIDNFSTLTGVSSKDQELLKFSIENIALEILEKYDIVSYSFDLEDGKGFLLNFSSESIFADKSYMFQVFEEILKCIELYMNFTATIGVGLLVDNVSDLPNSFIRAQESVSQRLSKGGNHIFFLEELPASKDISTGVSFKIEQDLLACFEKCDKNSAINLIESLYQPFRNVGIIDIGDFHKLNFQLILLIYKIMKTFSLNSEELLGDEFLLYNCLNAHSSIDTIIEFFEKQLDICFENISIVREKGNKKLMEKAKEFISMNYNKDITLESLSEHVHLSAAYFSKQFKYFFGENFVDYLINYRINKAKEFLKAGVYKANEVSKMIGFNNEKYFYKVFKRHTGFTPTEYKDI